MTFTPSCVLVTGGAGFIGSNFIRWVLSRAPNARVVNLDLLTYAGNLESLQDVAEAYGPRGDGRYYFIQGDVRDFEIVARLLSGDAHEATAEGLSGRRIPAPNCVVHMAAESHVDRSIMGPAVFVDTNVRGTLISWCDPTWRHSISLHSLRGARTITAPTSFLRSSFR